MKNKHRIFSMRALSLLCALMLSVISLSGALAASAPQITATYVPYESTNTPEGLNPAVKGLLTVTGNVGIAEKTPVVLMVLAKGKTENDLNNDIASFNAVVDSFRQLITNADGTFSISFGIGFDEDGVNSTKGDYVVTASYADAAILSDGFYYSTAAHVGEALDDVNVASDAQALKKEITFNSPKELVLDMTIYDELSSSQNDIITYVFKAKEALKASNGTGFPSGEALRSSFNEASLFYKLKSAEDAAELKTMLDTYKTELALSSLPAYKTYTDSLDDSGRLAVCEALAGLDGCEVLSDINALFTDETILTAVEKAGIWSNINPILQQNKAVLTAAGVSSSYFALADTSVPDKAIVNKTYATIDALKMAINNNIPTTAPSSKPSSSTGGGSSAVMPASPAVTPSISQEASPPPVSGFADMAGYEWASEAVNALKDIGIINGKSETLFAPADMVTREEFVKMLVSMLGLQTAEDEADFADVDPNAWYCPFVAAAAKGGIVNGIGDGIFGVGLNITRQDIATIACRAFDMSASGSAVKFTDEADISDYAKDSVATIASHGIISGMGDGSFAPAANATRAQAAKILYELYKWKESGV